MPMTPTYGFEYETPLTKPGITLTGDSDGSSPILAEQVETALAGIDSRLAAAEGDIAVLQAGLATDTGWLALSGTAGANFTVVSALYRLWGPMVSVFVECERTGPSLAVGATGNIVGDPPLYTINTVAARPGQLWWPGFVASNTSGGSAITVAGIIVITDANSGSTIATNDFVRVTATFLGTTFN